MTDMRAPAPLWFRIVAIVLLIWGVAGCYACLLQFRFGAEAMGPATAYDRALYASLPGWYDWVYALAVGAGMLGALALLTRSARASELFVTSLVAIVVQFGFLFATSDIVAVKGAATVLPSPIVIAAIAMFEVWLARHARRRGWIG